MLAMSSDPYRESPGFDEVKSLNQAFTRPDMRRRYESWFLRVGLADGSGAWWFRYLLTNPGRSGCQGPVPTAPLQVWATWFPRAGQPETFIQELPLAALKLHAGKLPFALEMGRNCIQDGSCRGVLDVRGQRISWDLKFRSSFASVLNDKGWLGFSRTPHSDAVFSGEIRFNDKVFGGDLLGLGVQGHNCGYRHRRFWTWIHACFPQADGSISTVEALVCEMPLGLVFRKAVVWHDKQATVFRKLRESRRDREQMLWTFTGRSSAGIMELNVNGSDGAHRVPYAKTDCSGTFEVSNNSRARARLTVRLGDSASSQELATEDGAVLEMAGERQLRNG